MNLGIGCRSVVDMRKWQLHTNCPKIAACACANGMMYTSMVYIWYNCVLQGANSYQEYLISQLLEWEYQPIKLIAPAIQKSQWSFFFGICVTLLFDQMQHLRIEQIYMPNIHKNKESICILLKYVDISIS